jgi:hypothetical protein
MSDLGKSVIKAILVGTIQREDGFFYARLRPGGDSEIQFPISPEQFHSIRLTGQTVKLTLEIE